jgi:FkbM family methyltransferase
VIIDHPVPVVIDVGANDGKNLSNSYGFLDIGWKAILVEPNPITMNKAKELWKNNSNVLFCDIALSNYKGKTKLFADTEGFEGPSFSSTIDTHSNEWSDKTIDRSKHIEVDVDILSNMLNKEENFPINFALLSIDTEGQDYEVLQGLSHYRPSMILTERSMWNLDKATKKQQLLIGYGYISAYHIGCNEIYVNSNCEFIRSKTKELSHLY